ncbi:hypothetical protein K3495_g2958 [Podosphaera aphanis]|nr:hypothetical protein K3495_g2958 [Podosphaera aphanis]
MANRTAPPAYLYKILPPAPPPPTPLPDALPLLALDARDGFIHLSTSRQVLRTLRAFFATAPVVYLLRIPYARVQPFIKWEDTRGHAPPAARDPWDPTSDPNYFPHIYANDLTGLGEQGLKLGRDEVDQVATWSQSDGVWVADGWPFAEDRPF